MIPCEAVPGHPEFTHLAGLPQIVIDLRYASADNFAERNLYGELDCAYLRRDAAKGLAQAADWLAARRPGYRLRVLDALRPQRVQEQLWAKLAGTPLELYLAHPERGSIHSFGMAVDVTLLDPTGVEVDMGSGFDELSERSHPALDAEHLALGVLSAAQIAERGWLRAAMRAGGFHGISSEWWHFDFGDRDLVRRQYARVL
jgi:D-alanyl-D-alanine dipeptidase